MPSYTSEYENISPLSIAKQIQNLQETPDVNSSKYENISTANILRKDQKPQDTRYALLNIDNKECEHTRLETTERIVYADVMSTPLFRKPSNNQTSKTNKFWRR